MKASSKNTLQQWQRLRTYDGLIAEKIERGHTVKEILAALGINKAFYQKYNLSKINPKALK